MRGPELQSWERRLRSALEAIDEMLEERYGARYPLRPHRPPAGATSSFTSDGLFSVHAKYTAGYGSPTGEGYIVELRWSTLADVPDEVRESIRDEVEERLSRELDAQFPDRDLEVSREGSVLKIHGDLDL